MMGAVNPHNKQSEYNYNIGVKEYLKKELEKDYLVEVYNREKNRVEQFSKINELKPDLIISLHCNAGANIEKKYTHQALKFCIGLQVLKVKN